MRDFGSSSVVNAPTRVKLLLAALALAAVLPACQSSGSGTAQAPPRMPAPHPRAVEAADTVRPTPDVPRRRPLRLSRGGGSFC